jgi:hypothetical protein
MRASPSEISIEATAAGAVALTSFAGAGLGRTVTGTNPTGSDTGGASPAPPALPASSARRRQLDNWLA